MKHEEVIFPTHFSLMLNLFFFQITVSDSQQVPDIKGEKNAIFTCKKLLAWDEVQSPKYMDKKYRMLN
jgi:hypothetical protein